MTSERASSSSLLVLGKIGAILDAFDLATPERSLADLRAATGLPASTVQRLAANLVEHGFLDRRGDRLRIGMRLATWSASAFEGLDVGELVQPVLAGLRDETGETACLSTSSGAWRVCVAVAESRHHLRQVVELGEVVPVHVGSPGRVLLAWDDALAEQVLAAPLAPMTSSTLVDPDLLRSELDAVRASGWATTAGERAPGVRSVSAPVLRRGGAVFGALSVIAPESRLTDASTARVIALVRDAAAELGRALGAGAPPGSWGASRRER